MAARSLRVCIGSRHSLRRIDWHKESLAALGAVLDPLRQIWLYSTGRPGAVHSVAGEFIPSSTWRSRLQLAILKLQAAVDRSRRYPPPEELKTTWASTHTAMRRIGRWAEPTAHELTIRLGRETWLLVCCYVDPAKFPLDAAALRQAMDVGPLQVVRDFFDRSDDVTLRSEIEREARAAAVVRITPKRKVGRPHRPTMQTRHIAELLLTHPDRRDREIAQLYAHAHLPRVDERTVRKLTRAVYNVRRQSQKKTSRN